MDALLGLPDFGSCVLSASAVVAYVVVGAAMKQRGHGFLDALAVRRRPLLPRCYHGI